MACVTVKTMANTEDGTFTVPRTTLEQKLMPGHSPPLTKHGLPSVTPLSLTVILSRLLPAFSLPRILR